MFQLNYCDKQENILSIQGTTECSTIENYRRKISINPDGYKVLNITNLDEQEAQKQYELYIKNRIDNTKKEVEKAIKAMIKNPIDRHGKMKYKIIDINRSDIDILKNWITESSIIINDYFIYNNDIEIYFRLNNIQINCTKEYCDNF